MPGRFLGIPYDWRRPTIRRFRQTLWNPRSQCVLAPKAYGWGYDVNFAALWRLLRRK